MIRPFDANVRLLTSINLADVDLRSQLLKNVVLTGGTSKLQGFVQRLRKELLERSGAVSIEAGCGRSFSCKWYRRYMINIYYLWFHTLWTRDVITIYHDDNVVSQTWIQNHSAAPKNILHNSSTGWYPSRWFVISISYRYYPLINPSEIGVINAPT